MEMNAAEEVNVGDVQDWNACRSEKFDMASFLLISQKHRISLVGKDL